MHAFIVGGSGQIGRAVAERLLLDGWDVTCAQRGAPLQHLLELGAKSVSLDRKAPGALRAAIGNGADAIVDVVAFNDEHARQLLELQDVVGQIDVISSASVYRDAVGRTLDEAKTRDAYPALPVPIPETQPTVEAGPQSYSTQKVALEQTLLQSSRVPVSLGWSGELASVTDEAGAVGETPWSAPGDFIVSVDVAARLGYKPRAAYRDYAPEVCRWLIQAAQGKDWRDVFPVLKYYGEMFDYAAEDAFFSHA